MPKKGYKQSPEHKQKLVKHLVPFVSGDSRIFKGKHSLKTRNKMSVSRKGVPLKKSHKTTEGQRLRASSEYSTWRKAVYERDNFTCMDCFSRGVCLNAHHVKPWAKFPELRFLVSNGVTLCVGCHQRRHKHKLY